MLDEEVKLDIEIAQLAELVVELKRNHARVQELNNEVFKMCLFCLGPHRTVYELKKAKELRPLLIDALETHLDNYERRA